jgi:hypothetical protein
MKTVYITKDSYQDNTVRVNFFEKNATKENTKPVINEKTGIINIIKIKEIYDKLLHCKRYEWVEDEQEIDEQIELERLSWENRINS